VGGLRELGAVPKRIQESLIRNPYPVGVASSLGETDVTYQMPPIETAEILGSNLGYLQIEVEQILS
jgi:hypothetical protein